MALHGDLEQREREQTLMLFNNQSVRILVATDVAARGLDIKALDLVLNVNLAHDAETHIHRIGRTGRAGEKGLAMTLVTEADAYKFNLLKDALKQHVALTPLPAAEANPQSPEPALMSTIQILAGKNGTNCDRRDIVGALTRDDRIDFASVGKISVQSQVSYVAVRRNKAKQALAVLGQDKLKGRRFRARIV